MLIVDNLTKYFGNFPAIERVSFEVGPGEIVGFLGPNGAGKTTTLRIITGYMQSTDGTVKLAGFDSVEQSLLARQAVGYLPESVPLYPDMTVLKYLEYMGRLRGVARSQLAHLVEEAVASTGIDEYRSMLIGKLSKGYRQRVGIAQAVLHKPPILILDEPTMGLDPVQVIEIRKLIKDLGSAHAIVLSTHLLEDVAKVCSRIIIIHEGHIAANASTEELSQSLQGQQQVEVEVSGPATLVRRAVENLNGVERVSYEELEATVLCRVHAIAGVDLRAHIAESVIRNGLALLRLEAVDLTLDDIFVRLTSQAGVRDSTDA